MGLGPDLSTIKLGAIFSAAQQSTQAGGNLLDLADQLSSVQGRTTANWQGTAGTEFGVHMGTRVQAKQLTGQALQLKGAALNDYGTQLQKAVQQWESGKNLLNSLPGQLKSQVLGGGGLSVTGLGITDPGKAASLLVQAGAALVQLVEAQAKAQAAGLQLMESLKGLQGLLDQAQSLLSGNQSQANAAPVAPADVRPWVLPLGLGAGGLGSMVMPLPQDPPIEGDPIPEPLPPILGDPIPVPLPPIHKSATEETPPEEGQDGQGRSGQGNTGQEGQGDGQGDGQSEGQQQEETGTPGLEPGPDVPQRIRDILFPGGQPIGTPQKGTPPEIRGLPDPQELQDVFDELKQGGTPHNPPTYPGDGYDLPDGGWVGERVGKNGPTIDINIPGVPIEKIHASGQ